MMHFNPRCSLFCYSSSLHQMLEYILFKLYLFPTT
jgi:hypothetical protein